MLVGNSWKIESDSLNVTLFRKHLVKKGKHPGETWKVHGYFGTVQNALTELVNQSVRDSNLTDLKTVCAKLDQIQADIRALSILSFNTLQTIK